MNLGQLNHLQSKAANGDDMAAEQIRAYLHGLLEGLLLAANRADLNICPPDQWSTDSLQAYRLLNTYVAMQGVTGESLARYRVAPALVEALQARYPCKK
ncbi:hypothetical protein RM531_08580 [Salinisphaera sp. P385]|uniref:Rap1a immunity protein domain-containing protein n=1 Tax=Spectribacter acetivorans TaxID=3075603 RepID=A0ABU3B7T3_9GAMM|nr:hypothetical protein [Salinisphaera sp. P385]MDT0618532.1 hypothetical protein [Salinisphaera sp. P385]